MRIIPFDEKYRDDMIFMILQAKDTLGHVPRLNGDLLDIRANYLDKGDMFWLALDDEDRVIGSVGYSSIDGTCEVWLHRFYVKANMKRRGIGSALYLTAEEHMRKAGKTCVRVHMGGEGYDASHLFYGRFGFEYYDGREYMKKELK